MVLAVCPNKGCGYREEVPDDQADSNISCPRCNSEISVPASKAGDSGREIIETLPFEPDSDPAQPISEQETVIKPATSEDGIQIMDCFGGYKILEKLGEGGMGAVYLALQMSLEREVALKVLPRELKSDRMFVERFRREASSMARLEHPNIVQIFDRGDQDGIYYIAMQYVKGRSLKDKLRETGKLPLQQAVKYMRQVVSGMAYAHRIGVIHRDVKPDNVLIDHTDTAKIADFGLAAIAGPVDQGTPALTVSNITMGTRAYMAPEQELDAKNVDHRADIFSMGVVFYELLTGTLPAGRFKHASELVAGLPKSVDAVIDKMLARDPEDRYVNCDDILTDLTKFHTGQFDPAVPGAQSETADTLGGQGKLWELKNSLWMLWLLPFGIFSWVSFLWVGLRAKRKRWIFWAVVYFLVFPSFMSNQTFELNIFTFSLWIISIIHAFKIRQEYILRRQAVKLAKIRASQQKETLLKHQIAREFGLDAPSDSSETMTMNSPEKD
ncbi:protein kinase [Planctomycetota bacterium]